MSKESNVVHSQHEIRIMKTEAGGDEFQVEAFVRPSEHTEAEIRINSEWIAGDKVYAMASDLASD